MNQVNASSSWADMFIALSHDWLVMRESNGSYESHDWLVMNVDDCNVIL